MAISGIRPTAVIVVPVVLPLLMMSAGGCANADKTTEAFTKLRIDYDAAEYQQSLDRAIQLRRSTSGQAREEATYIAGLSAYQLKRDQQAIRLLEPIANGRSPYDTKDMRSHAAATLGLLHERAKNCVTAADWFLKAAGMMNAGDDRAEARLHAGWAYQELGRESVARAQFIIALDDALNPELRDLIQAELNITGFTVQLGAFREWDNAMRTLADFNDSLISATSASSGLGAGRIVTSADDSGHPLYLVQVGHFVSMKSATDAALQAQAFGRRALVVKLGQ